MGGAVPGFAEFDGQVVRQTFVAGDDESPGKYFIVIDDGVRATAWNLAVSAAVYPLLAPGTFVHARVNLYKRAQVTVDPVEPAQVRPGGGRRLPGRLGRRAAYASADQRDGEGGRGSGAAAVPRLAAGGGGTRTVSSTTASGVKGAARLYLTGLAEAGFLAVSLDAVGDGERRLADFDVIFNDERWDADSRRPRSTSSS